MYSAIMCLVVVIAHFLISASQLKIQELKKARLSFNRVLQKYLKHAQNRRN